MISGPRKRVDTPPLDSSGVLGKSLLSWQKMQIRSGYVSGGCHFRGSGPKLSICRRYDHLARSGWRSTVVEDSL